ncbi:E3 ubiquitin-protein ligase RBBP6-like [Aricia agestis]|uniref:E3 ubiquitin-protein ligase RBBP6-like n=1 Tax=Aricia agestis TaxID=91739 RepID=UPI001C20171D|nr:E3 ubiquitin-protein ligase RBBP6-like [Aricia agestis]
MSDSDDNLTQHTMFENENTILRGQGSFFNQRFKNLASSTHTSMLQNFNSGYGFNHRSMLPINRRETSPMSLRSVPDFGHNYENSYYSRGRTCESVTNGRSQSPGSVGSMDSTTSAVYVAQIFKNMKFNKYDKRIINEAYNKYFRHRDRRRVSKRRKLKLFIKHNRRKSDDSGDEGSNSSMSSDDNRSVRSAIPKESVLKPSNRSNRAEILNFRETMKKSDMYTDCTENIRNSSLKKYMFNDNCTKPTLKLLNNVRDASKDCSAINPIPQETVNRFQSHTGTQRYRFTKGFSLPSERFNRSVMRPTSNKNMPYNLEKKSQNNPRSDDSDSDDDIIPNQTVLSVNNTSRKRMLENQETTMLSSEKRNKLSCDIPLTNPDDTTFKKPLMPVRRPIKSKANFLSGSVSSKSKYPLLGFLSHSMNKSNNNLNSTKKLNETISQHVSVQKCVDNQKPIDSDSDDIFTPNTNTQKQNQPDNKDRNGNKISPQNKRKQATPANGKKSKNQKSLPGKSPQAKNKEKLSPTENTTEEILISKSKQPLIGNVEVINPVTSSNKLVTKHTNNEKGSGNNSDNPLSVTDMSMKPSFIKRKLFTQKLDIADEKNDSLVAKSPHPTTYKLREKNKVRKFATSQSCLSRDIAGGDNMILDLIHKIVPANQMNMTSANHKTRNSQENEDRWDVTSVISMCNKTVESDTYTDEDIFQEHGPINNEKTQKNKTNKIYEKQKENVDIQNNAAPVQENFYTNDITTSGTNKSTAARCANAFWDTDFETDLEDSMRLPTRSPARNIVRKKEKEAQNKENIQKSNVADSKPNNLQNTKKLITDCKIQLVKQKDDIIVTKLSEKKGKSVKKGSSPKKGKCVETKEENNTNKVNKENKSTKLSQKNGKSPPKQDKHAETKVNNAKKESKESKTKSTDKKGELVKKASPPKKDKKENKIRTSPRIPKLGVKNVTNKNGDTKLNNETKRQPKNSAKKVLQENKIISTIKTRKQKSFLNDSLNSSCERSIFTRSFTLQNKQRLL